MRTTFLFFFFVLPLYGRAQEITLQNNALLVTAGGEGGFYAFTYERAPMKEGPLRPYYHAGLSVFALDQRLTTVVPLSAGTLYRRGRVEWQAGVGAGPNISYYYQQFAAGTNPSRFRFYMRLFAEAGGRYYFGSGKTSLGVRYTPIISVIENVQLEHWGAISFGYHF